jgi:hypothetical protein
MGVKLVSSGGGSVEINPPATASNFVATMPAGTGNVVVAGINSAIVSGTAVASTSGTSIDFTGIPSWVKRITVMLNGVSTNGSSLVILQIGDSGGVETSGYIGASSQLPNAGATAGLNLSSGVIIENAANASAIRYATISLALMGSNLWAAWGIVARSDTAGTSVVAGSKTLSDTLTQVRITTVNGTDTFDAGSINILYE